MTTSPSPDLSRINQDLHWAFQYLGRPWVSGATGPNSFDCWGLFRFVQKEHFGREVPVWEVDANDVRNVVKAIRDNPEVQRWTPTKTPKDGDAVLLAHANHPHHVGLWLDVDGGGVLHAVKGQGVIFSSLNGLSVCGWGRVEFYEHASNR